MLSSSNKDPISGERKTEFEKLRHLVPRYLFRAWSNKSGGGPTLAINSKREVIPHRFMSGGSLPSFYSFSENQLYSMVRDHYHHRKTASSAFSSWASSLHLVLCYASSMPAESEPHIAVIDTSSVEGEVMVWFCPHLIGRGDHEYLAYGAIRGHGYRAVAFKDLNTNGIFELFSELSKSYPRSGFHFGFACRDLMFADNPTPITARDFELAENLAQLFGPLFLPVYLALLCLRPRSCFMLGLSKSLVDQVVIHRVLDIFGRFNCLTVLRELKGENWTEAGVVVTGRFPDVEQWIGALRVLVQQQHLIDGEAQSRVAQEENYGSMARQADKDGSQNTT